VTDRTDDESAGTPDESIETTAGPPTEKKTRPKKKQRTPRDPEPRGRQATGKGKRRSTAKAAEGVEPSASKASMPLLVALVTLAIGVGIGWLVRGTSLAASAPTPAPSTSSSAAAGTGPCAQWATQLCEKTGDSSEACGTAKSAAELLPASACAAARADVAATLTKVQNARSACDKLVTKLCADIGEGTDSCKLVRERTPSFPTQQCQQMLEGYDEVVAELRHMEAKNAPLTPEVAAAQAAGTGPSFGPANAKVTVVEYSDFECPFCSRAATVVKKLKEKYADRVRFVFRQYPLPMHKDAGLASEAALEAHAQGKFWQLHDKMFDNQRALDRKSIEGYAQQIGLDMVRFRKALDDGTHKQAVKADQKLGDQIGVDGTPTMIVNAKRVPNPADYEALASLIDAELAAAN
jgi:protein-disulfide isomerase